jgi:hypothetical protein
VVGVLGCMAERLKTSLLEEDSVDFVCGPDAYRDIPQLVNIATSTGTFNLDRYPILYLLFSFVLKIKRQRMCNSLLRKPMLIFRLSEKSIRSVPLCQL